MLCFIDKQEMQGKNLMPTPPLYGFMFKFGPNPISKTHYKLSTPSYISFRVQRLQILDISNMTNVVELKVGLHCDECIKKILKAIKKVEDIETYDIDARLNKVTVTGNVTEEEVIRVINKIGKTASSWNGSEQTSNVAAGHM